ncbi:MAG: DUF485 domain-containing protein [Candidatus Coatesbacteria bacterium]|nr:DUF485 domain-containing protein [Candidatus Coatesbacteria bacterium]
MLEEHKNVGGHLDVKSSAYKTKLGVRMFLVYLVIYFGFVVINSVKPSLMGIHIGGVNLAIVYGMGLIVLALMMAMIYTHLCSKEEAKHGESDKGGSA